MCRTETEIVEPLVHSMNATSYSAAAGATSVETGRISSSESWSSRTTGTSIFLDSRQLRAPLELDSASGSASDSNLARRCS